MSIGYHLPPFEGRGLIVGQHTLALRNYGSVLFVLDEMTERLFALTSYCLVGQNCSFEVCLLHPIYSSGFFEAFF